nr:cytochrome c oxidase assembly protein [Paracoccus sp. (in: a-proteobacteria)]
MSRNSRTVLGLVAVVLTMGALSWAAVPFYNWFCKV